MIGSGICVRYLRKMVATSCVVYWVFFQSKSLPYYGGTISNLESEQMISTNLRRTVKDRLKILHPFRRAGNTECTLDARRRLLQMRATAMDKSALVQDGKATIDSPLGNNDRNITPYIHPYTARPLRR